MHLRSIMSIIDGAGGRIRNAVRCTIEVLDLKITLYDTEVVLSPSCVFLCESLTSLVLDMNYTILRTPYVDFCFFLLSLVFNCS